jgi:hypothetical protein
MRPQASFASESNRVKRGADVPERQVIVPMNGMVMPFVIWIAEGTNLCLVID